MAQELGIEVEVAERVMRSMVEQLCREFGGLTFYVPKVNPWALATRDRQIAAEYQGTNESLVGLARKHKLTGRQILVIIESELMRRRKVLATREDASTVS